MMQDTKNGSNVIRLLDDQSLKQEKNSLIQARSMRLIEKSKLLVKQTAIVTHSSSVVLETVHVDANACKHL